MNKQNLRPCVGGWLLIAAGAIPFLKSLITLFYRIVILGMPMRYITRILGYTILPDFLAALPLLTVGVVLVMKQTGIPVAIAGGVGLLLELLRIPVIRYCARTGFAVGYLYSVPYYILNSLPYVLLAILALIAVSPSGKELKKLWWLPAAFCGVMQAYSTIRSVINMIHYRNFSFSVIFSTALTFLFGMTAVVGFFFAGQWLADPLRKKPIYRPAPQVPQGNYYNQPQYYQPPQQPYPQPQYRPPVQQPAQSQPAAANSLVQELERAKHLLDSGAINQEEYDALKKRLLG